MSELQNLPKECLFYLFDHLDFYELARLSLTCKDFLHLVPVYIKEFKTNFNFTSLRASSCFNSEHYLKFTGNKTNIKVFNYGLRKIPERLIFETLKKNVHIQNLSLFFLKIDLHIPLKELIKLDLTVCKLGSGLLQLAQENKGIEQLTLRQCEGINDEIVETFAKNNKYLKFVNFGTSYYNRYLSDRSIISIAQNCANLKWLNIDYSEQVTDNALCEVGFNCKLLECLNIYGCKAVGDIGVNCIAENCILKEINVGANDKISDMGLWNIAEHLCKLTHLRMDYCDLLTDASIKQVVQNCQQLQLLSLAGCENITDEGLTYVSEYAANLEHLNVGYCRRVTDTSLCKVVKGCNKLRVLKIEKNMTGVTVECISKHARALEKLVISNCYHIREEQFALLRGVCCNLKTIHLTNCLRVKETGTVRRLQKKGYNVTYEIDDPRFESEDSITEESESDDQKSESWDVWSD